MSELTDPERIAVARVHALLELLPTALDKELAPVGLTLFEYTLLEALSEADLRRLRLSALAARTNATLPRLSRVVNALERKGYVLRAACEADGRATNAVLTEPGVEVYLRARPLFVRAVRELVLDGVADEGGPEALSRLAFGVLCRLDPGRRLAVLADASTSVGDPGGR
ncbi:MarR family transcriptional regulator [Microbacterium sp.]|uniref:MarR family winged helix-turn-helix transcriptional regulator n=1 Tax=Microbacterium sp. TaxID=51671 RepID=UPI0025EFAE26|nr:MarR family transcriptional regulator [Microbacterium sp.]